MTSPVTKISKDEKRVTSIKVFDGTCGKELIITERGEIFIISSNSIRNDPFFYSIETESGLEDYIEELYVSTFFEVVDENGKHTIGISYDVSAFAICSNSKHAEQAWSFIESYLGTKFFDETNMDAHMLGTWQYGIPSNRNVLRAYIDYIKTEGGPFGYTPQEDDLKYMREKHPHDYVNHPFTDEEESLFYDLLEHAEPVTSLDKICMSIITEEAGAYFSGQKDLDEVVEITQKRIQLFLTENR